MTSGPEQTVRSALADRVAADASYGGAACVLRPDTTERSGGGPTELDLVAGTRDGVRPWEPDTLVLCYSVAKPFAALTVLDAVADGALTLDQPVAALWPAYAAHGKGGTTVRHVLSHAAGLPRFPAAAAGLDLADHDGLVALLADAEPEHEPGSGVAEHALTYGHLCDELVRRATGATLVDRFRAIAADLGWDVHLALTGADLDRCADVVEPPTEPWRQTLLHDPRWGPALGSPPGLLDADVVNGEAFRRTTFAAVSAYASARGLAGAYADLAPGDGPVAARLGPDLHTAYLAPAASGHDRVLDREVTWTLGFQRDEEDLGMGGVGGCSAWWSLRRGYAAAYVTRSLGVGSPADVLWEALEPAATDELG